MIIVAMLIILIQRYLLAMNIFLVQCLMRRGEPDITMWNAKLIEVLPGTCCPNCKSGTGMHTLTSQGWSQIVSDLQTLDFWK